MTVVEDLSRQHSILKHSHPVNEVLEPKVGEALRRCSLWGTPEMQKRGVMTAQRLIDDFWVPSLVAAMASPPIDVGHCW